MDGYLGEGETDSEQFNIISISLHQDLIIVVWPEIKQGPASHQTALSRSCHRSLTNVAIDSVLFVVLSLVSLQWLPLLPLKTQQH